MNCSYKHEGKFSPILSRISVIKEDKHGMDYPVFCRQCEPCPAVDACSYDALIQNGEGIIFCKHDTCTGCGICVSACQYNAIKMNEASKPVICDLCNGEPVCVKKCPTKALRFGESPFYEETYEEVFGELKRRWGIVG
jgi:Fe-S-cluster-containing hydrogenase component 2